MTVVKWNPRYALTHPVDVFHEIAGLRRMFDQPLGSFFDLMPAALDRTLWRPAVDVVETKDAFLVKAEVPGVKAEDIQISLEGDTLTLTGERKQEKSVEEKGYTRVERAYGTFERKVLLPPSVDVDGVKASYENGVLEIRLPKKEEARPKRIAVQGL
jgi:HSP20 family protein